MCLQLYGLVNTQDHTTAWLASAFYGWKVGTNGLYFKVAQFFHLLNESVVFQHHQRQKYNLVQKKFVANSSFLNIKIYAKYNWKE